MFQQGLGDGVLFFKILSSLLFSGCIHLVHPDAKQPASPAPQSSPRVTRHGRTSRRRCKRPLSAAPSALPSSLPVAIGRPRVVQVIMVCAIVYIPTMAHNAGFNDSSTPTILIGTAHNASRYESATT